LYRITAGYAVYQETMRGDVSLSQVCDVHVFPANFTYSSYTSTVYAAERVTPTANPI